jgi:hypothetical protein
VRAEPLGPLSLGLHNKDWRCPLAPLGFALSGKEQRSSQVSANGPSPASCAAGLKSLTPHTAPRCESRAAQPTVSIAHLAETRFGFLATTFLPKTPRTSKELGFRGFILCRVHRCYRFGLKTPASWRTGISDYRTFWLKLFGLMDFFPRQFRCRLLLRELPGSVAGVYRWLLGPGSDGRFGACWVCFVAKNALTPTQEVLCMTKYQSLRFIQPEVVGSIIYRRPRTYRQVR